MAEKKHKKRKPEERERDELVRLFIKEFQEAPEELRSYSPQIADKIEKHISPKKSLRSRESPFYFYLTEREREFRLNSLCSIIEKFRADGQVSKEEAIKALEDAAALREYAEGFKDSLLVIAQRVLGLSLNTEEKQTISLIRGKPEHHSYVLVRGVTLSLTWDRKLIKIAVNPEEFVQRQKALSLVGCGTDTQSDVAIKHDIYLGGLLNDNKIIIDTSAFYALVSASDEFHPRAKAIYERLIDKKTELYTSPYIFGESTALIQHRLGFRALKTFVDSVKESLPFLWIDRRTHLKAWEMLEESSGRELSFVYCTTVVLAKALGATVFAFNEDFKQEDILLLT